MEASWGYVCLSEEGRLNCPNCGGENRDNARFCTFCGTTLALKCSACGTDLLAGARFCDLCGSPAGAAEPAAEPVVAARKVVTVLFADMTGSTSLEEEMDAETVRSLLDRFYATIRAEVDKLGGRVVKFTGDGLMAAFGVPEVHEDDASRALEAAMAMCAATAKFAEESGQTTISLKVGVNTGEVVVIDADDDVVGDAVNVAARLESAAKAGEVLVGEETWRLTRGTSSFEAVEPLVLKGKSEPVPAYRLVALGDAAELATPFVGRDAELEVLVSAFEEAVDANAARLVTIIGSPGLGKTRLTRELAARLADRAVVRETRCDPTSATFAPIAEALREANTIPESANEEEVLEALLARLPEDEPERERIASRAAAILGAGVPGSTEETFWALRRMIESAAARDLPRVLVLEDLHWAEPLLLDLVEHLAEWIRDAPVLLVGTARPELRDMRPSLSEGGRATAVIALEGLDQRATEQLAIGLLGTEEVPSELLAKIPASTDGNPLFVRELIRMLVDDGVLRRDGDAWTVTVDVEAIEVPPTIQSLLAARMDRLRSDERTVVELASVIGKEFYRGALQELASVQVREQLDACFESLRRKELIEPVGTYWIDEPVFRFHHALIRDAAYRRLLKESRADLHERVAEWIERKTSDVIGEHEELIGYHFEQAHEYLRQLGRLDDHADELGRRAAARLGEAAQRALDRDDLPAAAPLAGRALARLQDDDEQRSALLLIRCEALLSMGDVSTGATAVTELERIADSPRLAAWATCFAGQLSNYKEPERLRETEKRVAAAAAELVELGDPAGAAKAHTVHGSTLARLGRFAECETALDAALTAAREASDRRRITAVLGSAPLAALWGPNPVSRAGGRCLDLVRLSRITTGSPAVEVTSTRCQAVLEAFRGRADAARRMLRSTRRTLEALGLQHELLETELFSGYVELIAGDPAAAEPHLRTAHDGFRFVGVDVLAAQSAALLARVHLDVGEIEEAERFVDESEQLGGQDLKASIAWRAVRAEILARRGAFDEARALAEAAVELASRTDALIDHGDACRALAAVCAAAGDAAAASSASERALALYERKGATALLEEKPGAETTQVSVPTVSSRPENECTRVTDGLSDLFARRDWEELATIFSDDAVLDDRRSMRARDSVAGRASFVAMIKGVADIGTVSIVWEPFATRGERLALTRAIAQGRDVGSVPFSMDFLSVIEIDEEGLLCSGVNLDAGDIDAAVAELDERYAAGEGAPFAEVLEVLGQFASACNRRDVDAIRDVLAPDLVVHDHRFASLGTMRGDEWLQSAQALSELVSVETHFVQFHAIERDRVLAQGVHAGISNEGASVETSFHALFRMREDQIVRFEIYPLDDLDAAMTRFDELGREAGVAKGRLENECTRVASRLSEAFARREWDAMASLLAADAISDDRRALIGLSAVGREALVNVMKTVAEIGTVSVVWEPIATRGQRLALTRTVMRGKDVGSAAFGNELLMVLEIDDQGLLCLGVSFEEGELDAAMAELDERFIAGEGKHGADVIRLYVDMYKSYNDRDWQLFRALITDDFLFVDHRLSALGTMGRDEFVRALRELVKLIPGRRLCVTAIHALAPTIAVTRVEGSGLTAEGAEVSHAFQQVWVGRGRRLARLDLYPEDRLDAALERFDDFAGRRSSEALGNRASACGDRFNECFERRDWDGIRDLFADDVVFDDRRRGLQFTATGRDELLNVLKAAGEVAGRFETTTLAVRGETFTLRRMVAGGRGGPAALETEFLSLQEWIDGRLVSIVNFDPTDLDTALSELDDRFATGEGTPYADAVQAPAAFARALNDRDWGALRELLSPDLVFHDRRVASLGLIRGRAEWLASLDILNELPTTHLIVQYHAIDRDRVLAQLMNEVSQDADRGGFATTFHALFEIHDGLIARLDVFPIEDIGAARSQHEELGRATIADRLDNQAARLGRRAYACVEGRDFKEFDALLADECRGEDRRKGLRWDGEGRKALGARVRSLAPVGFDRVQFSCIATRGEHLVLGRGSLAFHEQAGESPEIDVLELFESDADGLIRTWVAFDPDDVDAAMVELDRRFADGEGSGHADAIRSIARFRDAVNARNWIGLRDRFTENLEFVDHRPVSLGSIRSPDEWIESIKALVEVFPVRHEIIAYHRLEGDLVLYQGAGRGVSDEGAPAETVFLVLAAMLRDGRIARWEMFPVESLDAAQARFEELIATVADGESPASADVLANRATRNLDVLSQCIESGDWDLARTLLAPQILLDDRRRGLSSRGVGPDAWIENFRTVRDLGFRRGIGGVIATRGDRLAMSIGALVDPSGNELGGGAQLDETDEDGLTCRETWFDPDDLDEAFAELDRRFIAGEGAGSAELVRMAGDVMSAMNTGDLRPYLDAVADDFVLVDHRQTGLGILRGARAWLDAVRAQVDLASAHRSDLVAYHALTPELAVAEIRDYGTWTEGSASWEITYHMLGQLKQGKVCRVEIFPVEQLDDAMSRFAELREAMAGTASGPRENACIRWQRRLDDLSTAGDWTAVGELFADEMVFEDRRQGMGVRLVGKTASLEHRKLVASEAGLRSTSLIATRGERLALVRIDASIQDFEVGFIVLHEFNDAGRKTANIVFEPEDLDSAYVELDERYAAGEGVPFADVLLLGATQRNALVTGDWDTYRSSMADDVVLVDHRSASLGEVRGLDAVHDAVLALSPLVRDVRIVVPVIHAVDTDRTLVEVAASAVADHGGGSVEVAALRLQQWRDGRVVRIELYPTDAIDAARVRFNELGRERPPIENVATRVLKSLVEAFERGDSDQFRRLVADDFVREDVRAGLGSRFVGTDAMIDENVVLEDLGFVPNAGEAIATRGDHLALLRVTLRQRDDLDVDLLVVIESGSDGRMRSLTRFDPRDVDAAFTKLDALYTTREGAKEDEILSLSVASIKSMNDRDWDGFRSSLADDLVFVDHRAASLGESVGADRRVTELRALLELMTSYHCYVRTYQVVGSSVAVAEFAIQGTTAEGSDVEISYHMVAQAHDGRIGRMEAFPIDRLDDALARFAELGHAVLETQHHTTAVRAAKQLAELICNKQIEGIASLMAEDFHFEDRRAGLGHRLAGRDGQIDNIKAALDLGLVGMNIEPLATRGDLLLLQKATLPFAHGDEIEFLAVGEVDASGRLTAGINFDLDDLDDAFDDLDERFAEGEGSVSPEGARFLRVVRRAYMDRDLRMLGSAFAEDVVFVDHRPGLRNETHGRNELMSSVLALHDLGGDMKLHCVATHRFTADGGVSEWVLRGTNAEGGAVEWGWYEVVRIRAGLTHRLERFALGELGAAIARFEELIRTTDGGGPIESRCARIAMKLRNALVARDWDMMADLIAADAVLEDRRPGLQVVIEGRGAALAESQAIAAFGDAAPDFMTLAVRGESLWLGRVYVRAEDTDAAFDAELLILIESDAEGRACRQIRFDADDLASAFDELDERFLASNEATELDRLGHELLAAYNRRDWARFGELYSDDFVAIDHRPVGRGVVGTDAHIASMQELITLIPNLRTMIVRIYSETPSVLLAETMSTGADKHGNTVEYPDLLLMRVGNAQIVALEFFSPTDLDQAEARFDELGSQI